MIKPRQQASHSRHWPDTQVDTLTPADAAPPTLAQVVRQYRQASAAAAAVSPIQGLEVSEINSDTAFDRLFGPQT